MGHSKKEEIARLKRERREAKAAKKRQENVREPHVRFLIVCEGKKTKHLLQTTPRQSVKLRLRVKDELPLHW